MKRNWIAAVVVAAAYAGQGVFTQKAPAAPGPVTAAQYERWKTDLSNWGRWGKDDQIGTLNLITPEKRRQAAALVREGVSVSLAGDADTEKAVDNPSPYDYTMLGLGTDRIGVAYHGIAHTHLDAWNHISANGVFYNGYKPDPRRRRQVGPPAQLDPQREERHLHARHPDRHPAAEGRAVSRTRYADPRVGPRGVGEAGRREGVGRRCAVRPHRGVGTAQGHGAMAARPRRGRPLRRPRPVGDSVASRARRGGDGQRPSQYVAPGPAGLPPGAIHDFALVYLGLPLFDNCDLEALADAAASRKRWSFLLTAAPLPIRGGTGLHSTLSLPFNRTQVSRNHLRRSLKSR
jgi:hypothetical protein